MNEKVTMQIRLSQHLYDEIRRIAEETGDSINGTLMHVAHLGLRMYKEGVLIPPDREEQLRHSRIRTSEPPF